MSERLGVKQVCGSTNQLGELWDNTYPVLVASFLRKSENEQLNELYLESKNVYSVWHNNKELARAKTTKGHGHAYKTILKKIAKSLWRVSANWYETR